VSKNHQYTISVIIVNYNVEFFLEQCLNAVQKAVKNISAEVYVVDNNSIDGSVEMVQQKFPNVNLIANKDNKGFSSANNQAIELSNAKYVLLLNPDTVIEEDTLEKVVDFMDKHPESGGLGVRMLDGKGNFLPESKRGLPTPAVAFYKIFGLSRLFPRSKTFAQYHAGHISEFTTSEIDILSGAFMLMRSEALEKVGLLDETFFMYGEDIDLSYRILKGGYKNYYFADTRIIHYKGESTKKSSVNYVFVFYRAMVIFAQKHFSQSNAKTFSFLINAAIYFRASLAIASRFVKKSFLYAVDYAVLLVIMYVLRNLWVQENIEFPNTLVQWAFPLYTWIWVTSNLITGTYDFPFRFLKMFKGTLLGTLIILVMYALFPNSWQFSRLFILTGAASTMGYYLVSRLLLHSTIGGKFSLAKVRKKRFAIVGAEDECIRVQSILEATNQEYGDSVYVSADEQRFTGSIGTLDQLDQVAHIYDVNEIVFCAKNTTAGQIIDWMTRISSSKIDFKIAQPDSYSLIGSNSIDTAGDLYVMEINTINKPEKRRMKRWFDVFIAIVLIISSPLILWFYSKKNRFFVNCFQVLFGTKSWVGYTQKFTPVQVKQLPKLRVGVLTPAEGIDLRNEEVIDKLNILYARDYSLTQDVKILLRGFLNLDR
jgi:GT2 family glycosyltransferase